jgi:hypothetical protein
MGATLDRILVLLPPQLLVHHHLLALTLCLMVTRLVLHLGLHLHQMRSGWHVSPMSPLINLPLLMVWTNHSSLYSEILSYLAPLCLISLMYA